jgi:hypothetical protein
LETNLNGGGKHAEIGVTIAAHTSLPWHYHPIPNAVYVLCGTLTLQITCEARLPRFLYDYISGGSFQENTLRANIAKLQTTLLRQRVMVDESQLNLSIHLWDQAMSLPIVLESYRVGTVIIS